MRSVLFLGKSAGKPSRSVTNCASFDNGADRAIALNGSALQAKSAKKRLSLSLLIYVDKVVCLVLLCVHLSLSRPKFEGVARSHAVAG